MTRKAGKSKRGTKAAILPDAIPDEADAQTAEAAEPASDDAPSPPDVRLPSLRKIAEALGVHYNTVDNWKRKGIEPVGTSPWSLKAFLLILRPANKLSECRPTTAQAKALWQWAFGVRGMGSVNPDDPAHGPTVGWGEERDRQGALKEMTARKSAWLDLEKKAGRLKDDAAVRELLGELRQITLGELSTVQSVANLVKGLSPTQRADLAEQLTAWQMQARARIAKKSDALTAAKDPAHGIPG